MLDRDGDGTITKNDLQEMLGRDFSPDEINQMIKDSGATGEPPMLSPNSNPNPNPNPNPQPQPNRNLHPKPHPNPHPKPQPKPHPNQASRPC